MKKGKIADFDPGTLVRIKVFGDERFFGEVIGKRFSGTWFRCIDEQGRLHLRNVSWHVAAFQEILGYTGTAGLLEHHAGQGVREFAAVWDQLPHELALEIATKHVEARSAWLERGKNSKAAEPEHFQMERYGAKKSSAFFTELYGRLVRRSDALGTVSRQPSDQKPWLQDLIAPSFEEALACFHAHPTPAMADLILGVFAEDAMNERLNHPDPLIIFDVFKGAVDPNNPYMGEVGNRDKWIADTVTNCLYVQSSTTLRRLKKDSADDIKIRVKDLLKGLSTAIVDIVRRQYEALREEEYNEARLDQPEDDIPPFDELDILP